MVLGIAHDATDAAGEVVVVYTSPHGMWVRPRSNFLEFLCGNVGCGQYGVGTRRDDDWWLVINPDCSYCGAPFTRRFKRLVVLNGT